jgi:hypothetical protein
MSVMSRLSQTLFVLIAAGLLSMTAAQAQYYGSASPPPLYPYDAQSAQPYAIQVAPNTYVIQRPVEQQRNYPYVRGGRGGVAVAAPKPGRFDRPHKPVDHTLIDELRKRHGKSEQGKTEQANSEPAVRRPAGRGVINTTKIVRDAPVVRETRRYVDDPPRIIERRQVVDDDTGAVETEQPPRRDDNKKRVISADAEVTILGPDRMSIRLFRKGQGPKANARAD